MPVYVEDCFLCPGNPRISGLVNEGYGSVYVFDNDHPAFSLAAPAEVMAAPAMFSARPARGICRVVCYAPQHNLTLAEMAEGQIAEVLRCWAFQTEELAARPDISHVLIFENKGEIVGVSNPHPHCQIYAADFVFKAVDIELSAARRFRSDQDRSLFDDIIDAERHDGQRVVVENAHAIAFVPYFARFPYEVFIIPKSHRQLLFELDDGELGGLAAALGEVLVRLDNLWRMSLPYVLVVHQAPCDGEAHPDYRCHIQIYPPLRQPGLQKYLAGVETGGGHFLNDKSPESAAAELRQVASVHYKRS